MATLLKPDPTIDEAEGRLREDLACAYRLVAQFGWDDLIFTHLSARVPGPEHHFLLNPYELAFDEITASSLVKVDLQGNPVGATRWRTNPAGFVIHSAVHGARADAQCVIHLHTPHGQAVAAQRDGLLPITQSALAVVGDLAYHDYEGIATDLDERARLVADLGTANNMILRNHGTLSVGETVADAFLRIYYLERACEAQILALSAGRDHVSPAPEGTPEKVRQQNGAVAKMVSRDLVWPALRRKMDRLAPDYRD